MWTVELRICCGRNLRHPAGTGPGPPAMAIQGRGARSGRERRSESWLGAQTPPRPHGEADADAGRRGTKAPRRPRAADASQAASATSVFTPAPDRAHADRARENHRESAADSRKQAARPAQGARTAKRQGVTAISRLPNPRDARRNAHPAPSRRAPGIGRTCTAHEAATSAWHLAAEAEFSLPAKRRSPLRPLFTGLRRFSCTKKWGTSKKVLGDVCGQSTAYSHKSMKVNVHQLKMFIIVQDCSTLFTNQGAYH